MMNYVRTQAMSLVALLLFNGDNKGIVISDWSPVLSIMFVHFIGSKYITTGNNRKFISV